MHEDSHRLRLELGREGMSFRFQTVQNADTLSGELSILMA